MSRARTLAAAAVLAALLGRAPLAQAQDALDPLRDELPATLTVTGEGQVSAPPDRAVMIIAAEVQAEDAAVAQQEVSTRIGAAIEALLRLGVVHADLQTVGLSVAPVYADEKGRRGRAIAYRASNALRVVVTELDRMGALIDAAMSSGLNRIDHIAFELSDEDALRERALQEAARQALSRARALAASLGLELREPLEVSEGGVHILHEPHYELARGMSAGHTPIERGEVRIQAAVTVRYRIAPRPAGAPPTD